MYEIIRILLIMEFTVFLVVLSAMAKRAYQQSDRGSNSGSRKKRHKSDKPGSHESRRRAQRIWRALC